MYYPEFPPAIIDFFVLMDWENHQSSRLLPRIVLGFTTAIIDFFVLMDLESHQ
jgi:hypothetical protein